MTNKKDIKKELARMNKESDKLLKELCTIELSNKLKCVVDTIQRSELLSGKITSLPSDEVRVVMTEVINSPEFISLFERTLESSSKLAELRRNKAEKAEKRKHISEQPEPYPDTESVSEII